MKTIKNIGLKLAVIMAVFMAVPAVGQAQVKKGYANDRLAIQQYR